MTEQTTRTIRVTEIDGVPAVWADCDGPLRAGLTFRVGVADEQPLTRGITHLVEHLALHGIERPGDHSNGHVDATTLNFHVHGEPERVVQHLATITRQLHALPEDRLAAEVAILRAEAANRETADAAHQLLVWRYGATSYGLGGLEEQADRITPADLREWAGRYATRGNAVLMLTGPPPAGLRLELPDGVPMPPPDPHRDLLVQGRRTIPGGNRGVSLHGLVERSWAVTASMYVLQSRLVDQLRTEQAVSYAPSTAYERLTATLGAVFAAADLPPDKVAAGTESFLRVLADAASDADGRNARYLEDYRTHVLQAEADPQSLFANLAGAAWELLHGGDVRQPAESFRLALEVETGSVADSLRQICDSAVLRLPPDARQPEGWQAAPVSVHGPVSGVTYRPTERKDESRLVVGGQGISRTFPEGQVTVLFDEVVLMYRDGNARCVVGRDASRVIVDAGQWRSGWKVLRTLDDRVPWSLVVATGAGVAPVPVPQSWWRRLLAWLWLVAYVAIGVGAVVLAVTGRPAPLVIFVVSGAVQLWYRRN